jgi:hypothetical protein
VDTSISRPQCIAPRQRPRPENIGAPTALEPKEPADSRLAQCTPVRRQVVEDRTVRTIVAIAFDDQTRREQAAPGVPLELAISALGLTGVTACLWRFEALSWVREDHVSEMGSATRPPRGAVVIFTATVDPVTAGEVCGIAWPSIYR